MPKSARSAGTQWGGLNKRVDPVELPPEQSPDCANVYFYDQTMGLLGPRMGKAYAGASADTIWGVCPYNIAGQVGALIGYGDANSSSINLLSLYNVTYPHGGWGDGARDAPAPDAVTINKGFVHATVAFPEGIAPADYACNVLVNGATEAMAAGGSIEWLSAGVYTIYIQFDSGAFEAAAQVSAEYAGASSGSGSLLNVSTTLLAVDCTGKTALTGVRVVSSGDGTETFSGDIIVMGHA